MSLDNHHVLMKLLKKNLSLQKDLEVARMRNGLIMEYVKKNIKAHQSVTEENAILKKENDLLKAQIEALTEENKKIINENKELFQKAIEKNKRFIERLNFSENDINEDEFSGPTEKGNYDNIWEASENGDLPAIKYFYNLSPTNIIKKNKRFYKYSPLHYASLNGHLKIVKFLICKGAEVDAININGHTPLNLASFKGHIDIINYLIDNRANVNYQKANDNYSPIHASIKGNNLNSLKLLIDRGANINILYKNKFTPLEYAKKFNKSKEIINYLTSLINHNN